MSIALDGICAGKTPSQIKSGTTTLMYTLGVDGSATFAGYFTILWRKNNKHRNEFIISPRKVTYAPRGAVAPRSAKVADPSRRLLNVRMISFWHWNQSRIVFHYLLSSIFERLRWPQNSPYQKKKKQAKQHKCKCIDYHFWFWKIFFTDLISSAPSQLSSSQTASLLGMKNNLAKCLKPLGSSEQQLTEKLSGPLTEVLSSPYKEVCTPVYVDI